MAPVVATVPAEEKPRTSPQNRLIIELPITEAVAPTISTQSKIQSDPEYDLAAPIPEFTEKPVATLSQTEYSIQLYPTFFLIQIW